MMTQNPHSGMSCQRREGGQPAKVRSIFLQNECSLYASSDTRVPGNETEIVPPPPPLPPETGALPGLEDTVRARIADRLLEHKLAISQGQTRTLTKITSPDGGKMTKHGVSLAQQTL